MASPVDFISGLRNASSPRSFAKEKAGALTKKRRFSGRRISPMPCACSDSPSAQRTAMSVKGQPVALERKGTLREARGLTSMQ